MAAQFIKTTNPIVSNFDSMSDDSYIRPRDCALLIQVSIATFWRIVARGELKTYKLTERTTTIKVGELRSYIAKRTNS